MNKTVATALDRAIDTRAGRGSEERTFTITALAEQFAITARTIRFYEDKGLLRPARNGLNRVYSRRDRARLQLILRGKRVGFSLAEIKEMLDLYDIGDGQVGQLRHTLKKIGERLEVLEQQRRDIDDVIAELREGAGQIGAELRRRGVVDRGSADRDGD